MKVLGLATGNPEFTQSAFPRKAALLEEPNGGALVVMTKA
jgi:hypothetical protein